MINVFRYCKSKNKIISFYSNRDDTAAHLTGYVLACNTDEIIIQHISQHGRYDGFILKHTDDIFRAEYDGQYEKRIERLYHLKKQQHIGFQYNEETLLSSFLEFVYSSGLIITLEFQDNTISGLLNGFDNSYLYLDIIDDSGTRNGTAVVCLDEVNTFSADTEDEQDLTVLYHFNYPTQE